jgi:hypothetical protein
VFVKSPAWIRISPSGSTSREACLPWVSAIQVAVIRICAIVVRKYALAQTHQRRRTERPKLDSVHTTLHISYRPEIHTTRTDVASILQLFLRHVTAPRKTRHGFMLSYSVAMEEHLVSVAVAVAALAAVIWSIYRRSSRRGGVGTPHPACALSRYSGCVYLDYNATTPIFPEVARAMKVRGRDIPTIPSCTHLVCTTGS